MGKWLERRGNKKWKVVSLSGKSLSGDKGQNSRKLQNQSTMVVQGHLIREEAELVTSKVSKDKNTVKKKKMA